MKKILRAIRIGIPVLGALVFCLWLSRKEDPWTLGTIFALVSAALFTFVLTAALSRFAEGIPMTEEPHAVASDTARERLAAWGLLLGFGVAVTLFQFLLVYLLSGTESRFLDSFPELYYRSDVAHYMGIARDWYVTEGDERLRLVFLPLYSLAVRALTWNGDYFWGSFAASQLFSLLCLPAAYELFRLDLDRREAMTSARILFLLPGAAFLRVPMSEGLFLLLTVLAVHAVRMRRFLLSCLLAALSAFTRSLGALLLGLVFAEMLYAFGETWRVDRQRACRAIPKYIVCLLLGCSGTIAYLVINWRVSGDPFTFLVYQRENWTQELGLFFNTAAYQTDYALYYYSAGDMESVLSLSIPNLLCCFGALGLLAADRKNMRVSYLLWSLVYFAVAVGATWLLSGPRYLAMLFPLAPALLRLCKSRAERLSAEAFLLFTQMVYLLMLALDMSVY